jgi:hypothetical protein
VLEELSDVLRVFLSVISGFGVTGTLCFECLLDGWMDAQDGMGCGNDW